MTPQLWVILWITMTGPIYAAQQRGMPGRGLADASALDSMNSS